MEIFYLDLWCSFSWGIAKAFLLILNHIIPEKLVRVSHTDQCQCLLFLYSDPFFIYVYTLLHFIVPHTNLYSLRSFLSVTLGEIFCSYLTVTFKVQCNNKCCFTNITFSHLLQREKYMK